MGENSNDVSYMDESDVDNSDFLMRKIRSDLARIYREIDALDDNELNAKLRKYYLSSSGDINSQRLTLKHFYEKVKFASKNLYINDNLLEYYVVVDFEATCEAINPPGYMHEIIEFPAILVNSRTLKFEDSFHRYCRPTRNKVLSEFCVGLTGISQQIVDASDVFSDVLTQFEEWLKSHQLGAHHKFALVFDGPWDVCRFLYGQCVMSNILMPPWAQQWVNIRKIFRRFYCQGNCSLLSMLDFLKMEFKGRHHCGMDDARNIATVLMRLICDGAHVQVNEAVHPESLRILKSQCKMQKSLNDIDELLESLNLEGDKVAVSNTKLVPFKNIKRERCIQEAKLAKTIAREGGNAVEYVASSVDQTEDIGKEFNWPKQSKRQKNKKRGKPRRY